MKGKMKREMERGGKINFSSTNVSGPSNPPDELAQNVSKQNPFRTNYSSIFSSKVQNLTVLFNYLHDSNSIFRVGGINSENVPENQHSLMSRVSRPRAGAPCDQ